MRINDKIFNDKTEKFTVHKSKLNINHDKENDYFLRSATKRTCAVLFRPCF